jgi:hypothetical protein
MFNKTFGDLHLFLKLSEPDISIEHYAVEIVRLKCIVNEYFRPVLCPTGVLLEYLYFFFS